MGLLFTQLIALGRDRLCKPIALGRDRLCKPIALGRDWLSLADVLMSEMPQWKHCVARQLCFYETTNWRHKFSVDFSTNSLLVYQRRVVVCVVYFSIRCVRTFNRLIVCFTCTLHPAVSWYTVPRDVVSICLSVRPHETLFLCVHMIFNTQNRNLRLYHYTQAFDEQHVSMFSFRCGWYIRRILSLIGLFGDYCNVGCYLGWGILTATM